MSDRFPYNLPSRAALCVEIRKLSRYANVEDKYVTFEDMFFSPTANVPGRTYIEMVDLKSNAKGWFVYRRLDLKVALGANPVIRLSGDITPKAIAEEINRSRGMTFGADDLSFSTEPLYFVDGYLEYTLKAMTGSYAYFGSVTVSIEDAGYASRLRLLEDRTPRQLESGEYRLL